MSNLYYFERVIKKIIKLDATFLKAVASQVLESTKFY